MKNNLVIFTDLDGTLLDSLYSFKKALTALRLIKERGIPLILCSSKTRAEIEHYRKKLLNTRPFISENGGGIFVPKNYRGFQVSGFRFQVSENEKYYIIRLGAKYSDLRRVLEELRLKGFDVRGFGDMSVMEIAKLTGLKISEARMAKQRDFDEPFIFKGSKNNIKRLLLNIKKRGFNYTQGKFFHIMGNSNKGRAVEILKKIYAKQNRRLITAALGDSPNDIEMLEKVDYPIAVKKADGSYDSQLLRKLRRVKSFIKADGIGPEGWNKAVNNLLRRLL
jgi:mannosyl-3-phosphoglycerate phosphatase